jgi:hypothetical protein
MTTMMYFDGLTVAEIKSAYRRLARENHPDLGGDTEVMQEINRQYEAALKACNGQVSRDAEGTEHTYKWDEETERRLMEMIDKLIAIKMENVNIDLIGIWIWITGDTKPHRKILKAMGCIWHSTRGCWYYKPYEGKHWGSDASLEDLAKTYGITDVNNLKKKKKTKKEKQMKPA